LPGRRPQTPQLLLLLYLFAADQCGAVMQILLVNSTFLEGTGRYTLHLVITAVGFVTFFAFASSYLLYPKLYKARLEKWDKHVGGPMLPRRGRHTASSNIFTGVAITWAASLMPRFTVEMHMVLRRGLVSSLHGTTFLLCVISWSVATVLVWWNYAARVSTLLEHRHVMNLGKVSSRRLDSYIRKYQDEGFRLSYHGDKKGWLPSAVNRFPAKLLPESEIPEEPRSQYGHQGESVRPLPTPGVHQYGTTHHEMSATPLPSQLGLSATPLPNHLGGRHDESAHTLPSLFAPQYARREDGAYVQATPAGPYSRNDGAFIPTTSRHIGRRYESAYAPTPYAPTPYARPETAHAAPTPHHYGRYDPFDYAGRGASSVVEPMTVEYHHPLGRPQPLDQRLFR